MLSVYLRIYILTLIIPSMFIWGIAGCKIFGAEETENTFIIDVESFQAPHKVMLGDTVEVKFFGRIGSNGCFSFSHFESHEAEDGIDIEAHGKYNHSRTCPSVIVTLDGQAYNYIPETRGTKIIRVIRLERDPLEQTILVE